MIYLLALKPSYYTNTIIKKLHKKCPGFIMAVNGGRDFEEK